MFQPIYLPCQLRLKDDSFNKLLDHLSKIIQSSTTLIPMGNGRNERLTTKLHQLALSICDGQRLFFCSFLLIKHRAQIFHIVSPSDKYRSTSLFDQYFVFRTSKLWIALSLRSSRCVFHKKNYLPPFNNRYSWFYSTTNSIRKSPQ